MIGSSFIVREIFDESSLNYYLNQQNTYLWLNVHYGNAVQNPVCECIIFCLIKTYRIMLAR